MSISAIDRRERCAEGRVEGTRMMLNSPDQTKNANLQIEVAKRLLTSDGLEQNYNQGIWYEVGKTPLCFIKTLLEERGEI